MQPRDCGPMRTIDLKRDEIVAIGAHAPGRIDVGDDTALKLECRISGVVSIRLVGFAVLIPALRDVRCPDAGNRLHFAVRIIQHVTPVTQHVENDAATFGALVVPRWPLDWLQVSYEDTVANLATDRQHASEEATVAQEFEL